MDTGGCHPGVYFTYGSYSNPKNFNVTTSYYLFPLDARAAKPATTQPPKACATQDHKIAGLRDVNPCRRTKCAIQFLQTSPSWFWGFPGLAQRR